MTEPGGSGLIRYDVADILSVVLVQGSDRTAWATNGDAVLVDGSRGIVAVADGPERNPAASSAFLRRFRTGVSGLIEPGRAVRFAEGAFDALVEATNLLIRDTAYHDGTTFSAVVVGEDGGAAALHTGDSLIYRLRPAEGTARQLSRTNHCLVGRTLKLFQAEVTAFGEDDLFLVASDGLANLARSCGQDTAPFLEALLAGCAGPAGLTDALGVCAARVTAGRDDIGVVVVRPGPLARAGGDLPIPPLLPEGTG